MLKVSVHSPFSNDNEFVSILEELLSLWGDKPGQTTEANVHNEPLHEHVIFEVSDLPELVTRRQHFPFNAKDDIFHLSFAITQRGKLLTARRRHAHFTSWKRQEPLQNFLLAFGSNVEVFVVGCWELCFDEELLSLVN